MVNIARKLQRIEQKPSKKLNVFLRQPRTIQMTQGQSGKIKSVPRDQARKALTPGKRISKKGNIYWETRKNRSDYRGST